MYTCMRVCTFVRMFVRIFVCVPVSYVSMCACIPSTHTALFLHTAVVPCYTPIFDARCLSVNGGRTRFLLHSIPCMNACIFVCMYVCGCICIFVPVSYVCEFNRYSPVNRGRTRFLFAQYYMHACMNVYMSIYVCMRVCLYLFLHACMYLCKYVRVMYAHIYTRTHL